MSNPDATSGLGGAGIGGLLLMVLSTALFSYSVKRPILYHVGVIITAFLISMIIHVLSQKSTCHAVNGAKLFYGSLISVGTAMIGLFLASFAVFRIPVASVVAPLFKTTPVTKTKCCDKMITLEELEKNITVKGASYGFYLLFAMLFGVTYGNSIAVVC
jgi:hypothetical protein